jgi:hypothetical protein
MWSSRPFTSSTSSRKSAIAASQASCRATRSNDASSASVSLSVFMRNHLSLRHKNAAGGGGPNF